VNSSSPRYALVFGTMTDRPFTGGIAESLDWALGGTVPAPNML